MPVRLASRSVEAAGKKTPGPRLAEALHLVQHEQLIEGAVVERARKRFLIVVGAVLVIDGHGDESFAREILREVAHEESIAGIAVRNDDERKASHGHRSRVAHRLPVERRADRRVARDCAIIAAGLLSCEEGRGIPDLERQRAIVAKNRPAFFDV